MDYGLGSGISCTVVRSKNSAKITHDASSQQERAVALKRYNEIQDGSAPSPDTMQKLYRWLLRELRIFCHPFLRKNENICKLHYVQWEEFSITPSLGLELGTFGTLDDCLQDLRSYSSTLRKSHLSLDIALGLQAIHKSGLVHGDMKPRNIIICQHVFRSVTAKIFDFCGTSPAETYDAEGFTLGSPTWQPIEVLLKEKGIDWQLADTYAFGMILATTWSSTGKIPSGGTFLDPHFPYDVNHEEKSMLLALYKISSDDSSNGMVHIACQSVPRSDEVDIPVREILRACLSTSSKNQLALIDIIKEFLSEFANSSGRGEDLSQLSEAIAFDPEYWNDDVSRWFTILLPEYCHRRPPIYKIRMFHTILAAGCDLLQRITLPAQDDVSDIGDMTDADLLGRLVDQNRHLTECISSSWDLMSLCSVAPSISMSYLLGIGTAVDEEAAMHWLRIAALCQEGQSQYMMSPLEQSTGLVTNMPLPRNVWSYWATFLGPDLNSADLSELNPSLYKSAARMSNKCRWGRANFQIHPSMLDFYLETIMGPIRQDHAVVNSVVEARPFDPNVTETALHVCAAIGDMDLVKYLVLDADADINCTNSRNETPIYGATRAGHHGIVLFLYHHGATVSHISTEGFSICHYLAFMDDEPAANLAPFLVERGGRLDLVAQDTMVDHQVGFRISAGTPLLWAASKSKPILFSVLLELHGQPGRQISPKDYYALLENLARSNHHEMLKETLDAVGTVVNLRINDTAISSSKSTQGYLGGFDIANWKNDGIMSNSNLFHLGIAEYSNLLYAALNMYPSIVLRRRVIHRGNFRASHEATIRMLLELGADPTMVAGQDELNKTPLSPLSISIASADSIAFSVMIAEMERRHSGVVSSVLSDASLFGGCSALHMAVHHDAQEIFLLLLESYPELLQVSDLNGGRPLHAAAVQERTEYVRDLLAHGADPLDLTNGRSTPFKMGLIWNTNTESSKRVMEMMFSHAGPRGPWLLDPELITDGSACVALMEATLLHKLDYGVERLEYLIEQYERPNFYFDEEKTTLFRWLLLQRFPPSDLVTRSIRALMLKVLLDTFPEKMDSLDKTGRSLLQMSVSVADVAALEVLLERKANVNLETQIEGSPIDKYTALGLGVLVLDRTPPNWIQEGGQREITAYELDRRKIVELLLAAGSDSGGRGASLSVGVTVTKLTMEHGTRDVIHVMNFPERPKGPHRAREGDWPSRLPWDSLGPSPFGPDGKTADIEIIGSNGLSTTQSEVSILSLQVLLGSVDSKIRSLDFSEVRPSAPHGFIAGLHLALDTLKSSRISNTSAVGISEDLYLFTPEKKPPPTPETLASRAEIETIRAQLPAGWEARRAPKGRIYYLDHKNRTTTWKSPLVDATGARGLRLRISKARTKIKRWLLRVTTAQSKNVIKD